MPIVFIPGIKGSELVDTYPVDFPVRWSLEDMTFGNLTEDESDFLLRDGTYDTRLHLFREWRPIRYAYGEMIQHLRKHDPHCYIFTYDWRRQIDASAQKLATFIQHVVGRHSGDVEPNVSFVTHSMGALVLRSALTILDDLPLHRIVFIAPPFRGAIDICKVLVAGEKNGWLSNRESYRKLARSFPSVYQLIPNYANALVSSHNGTDLDPFAITNWQNNVTAAGTGFSHTFLANAEAFLRGAEARWGGNSHAPLTPDQQFVPKWGANALILLGTGKTTNWQVPIVTRNRSNPNWLDFANARHDSFGDERVHMRSAAVRGITLAAFDVHADHGRLCREEIIQDVTVMWLRTGRALKMRRRTQRNSIRRPSKTYFAPWDGSVGSFSTHRV